jgi:hypothetical protein
MFELDSLADRMIGENHNQLVLYHDGIKEVVSTAVANYLWS